MAPVVDWTLAACARPSRAGIRRRVVLREQLGITRDTWLWRAMDGHIDTMDTITDHHLLMVDRYLTGRGELEFVPDDRFRDRETFGAIVDVVRAEVYSRGLRPVEEAHPEAIERERRRMPTNAPASDDEPVELQDTGAYFEELERRYTTIRRGMVEDEAVNART